MDIPNNNVDSDADSNISQILLSDDDRKPCLSAWKDPPSRGYICKEENSESWNSKQEGSSKSQLRGYEGPSDEEISIYEGHQNHIPAINSGSNVSQRQQNWNTEFMVTILVSIHFRYKVCKKELAVFCATLQTSSRNNHSTSASSFQMQTIKYLDQIEKEFDGAIDQYIEQMETSIASSKGDRPQDFIEYDITKGDTFPCPKCGHMIVMQQLDTTETIGAYNHKPIQSIGSLNLRVLAQAKKSQVQGVEVYLPLPQAALNDGGLERKLCEVPVQLSNRDPKELEEDTAPKTMPGLVSMIHDSIAEATCAKFLEDTTSNKQDITHNACPFFQKTIKEGMGPIKNTIDGKNIASSEPSTRERRQYHQMTLKQTRAGSLFQLITINGETDNSNQRPRTLMDTTPDMAPAKEIKQTPQYVRDGKMETFDRSCKENTAPETCNVVDLMAENLTN
eukprot:jgi/Psemu1/30129/gm1.30129_g